MGYFYTVVFARDPASDRLLGVAHLRPHGLRDRMTQQVDIVDLGPRYGKWVYVHQHGSSEAIANLLERVRSGETLNKREFRTELLGDSARALYWGAVTECSVEGSSLGQ